MSDLTLRIRGLHPATTTYDVWRNFAAQGTITFIELFEDRYGLRDGNGQVTFSPPPENKFWTRGSPRGSFAFTSDDNHNSYIVHLSRVMNKNRSFIMQSPARKVIHDGKIELSPAALDFGVKLYSNSVMPLKTVNADNPNDISFVVDLLHGKLIATFKITFKDPRGDGVIHPTNTSTVGQKDLTNRYMFQIPFSQLKTIHQVEDKEGEFSWVISLEYPPQFLRRRTDGKETHSNESLLWTEFDSWSRQTDVVYDPSRLQNAPLTLQKHSPVVDIGCWTTYRFVFRRSQNDANVYNSIKHALQSVNIEIVALDTLNLILPHTAQPWSLLDPPEPEYAVEELRSLEDSSSSAILPFEVRYQLEVCISWGILNEHNITKGFLMKLAEVASKDSSRARKILEYTADQNKRVYDPITIFEDEEGLSYSLEAEVPNCSAYSLKATVTPTRIYFNSPTVESTNRVLRHYATEYQDGRFLRVQFTDEIPQGRINSCAAKQRNDALFTRIFRTLSNGIRIGDRLYEFLAFGNSQFRENGAYFFCPTDHLSCNDIRQWMGNFSHINIPAKYAARLGQCFSTTRAIKGLLKPDIVKIPDINSNGYCFTDGVGKISPFLAQMIAVELGLRSDAAPSAFQFRLGGCKGILVVSPDAKDKEVHIRKSQEKFTATYNGLEIIRCAQFSCAALNRQTITILSSLGVRDEVFLQMLSKQLSNYQNAMDSKGLALDLLSKYVDDNRVTINLAHMILNGFMTEREPFVLSLLHLWRAWSIKVLKEKARIVVEKGAFVFGCVDETATLKGYTRPVIDSGEAFNTKHLPQIFIQVPDKDDPNHYKVIEAICLVGRNPSLHPGDIRVVQAINVPALHHLRDVVVFPQNGERDIPSMCSGGDLDGDEYFVIWDEALRPLEWNCDPMSYAATPPRTRDRPVEVVDLTKFFVRFMKNDTLPTIAHAHLALSDYLDGSVRDPRCLELAALHSKAVDYVKTGQPAEMPKRLRPTKWPHFMEKKNKPKNAQYHSEKILGQLYDMVERVRFIPQWKEPFDKRILKAYKLDDSTLTSARQIKRRYDTAMRRIMAQQDIRTEFEVWSTFALSRPRVGNEFKLQEVLARISGTLKDQFRTVCIEKAGGEDFCILGPFVAAMYRVTKEELDIALAECRSTKLVRGREVPKRELEPEFMPLISFPWLFEKELGRIATGTDVIQDLRDASVHHQTKEKFSSQSHEHQSRREVEVEDGIQQDYDVNIHPHQKQVLARQEMKQGDPSENANDDTTRKSSKAIMATSFRETDPYSAGRGQYFHNDSVKFVTPRAVSDSSFELSKKAMQAGGPGGLGPPTVNQLSKSQIFNRGQTRKILLEGSLVDDSITTTNALAGSSISVTFSHFSPALLDLELLNSYEPANMAPETKEEVVEESVTTEYIAFESPLEKLARLLET